MKTKCTMLWRRRALSGENSSLRKQATFRDTTNGFPAKWRLSNDRKNSILMTFHYPDLGSASDWLKQISLAARLIRSITQIWVVTTRRLCGISANSPQMPFNWSRREISAFFLRQGDYEIIKGDATRNDSQRRFLAQHSVAMLEQWCNHSKQCRNNVATLCCAKNRRCESSRVTSP